jgi:hypothetical protein
VYAKEGAGAMKTIDEWEKENPMPPRCSVCALPPEVRAEVERAKHEKKFGPVRIEKYTTDIGFHISVDGISKHFQKQRNDPDGPHSFKVKGK